MRPKFSDGDLDAELVFDRYLGDGDDLDLLQVLLSELAPRWSSKLRLWRGPKDQRSVDLSQHGAIKASVIAAVGDRGSMYRALVKRHGQLPHERLTGSAELRGSGPELVVVVSLDQIVLSPLANKKQLGNGVALQLRGPQIERGAGDDWLRGALETLCSELSPAWASARQADEYWAKVMSDPPGVEASGRDFGRFLPGVFW
jgi:hypothetical protein